MKLIVEVSNMLEIVSAFLKVHEFCDFRKLIESTLTADGPIINDDELCRPAIFGLFDHAGCF